MESACAECGEYAAYGQPGGTSLCGDHAMIKHGLDPTRLADNKTWLDGHCLKSDHITPDMLCYFPSDDDLKTPCEDNALSNGLCYVHWMRTKGYDPVKEKDLRTVVGIIKAMDAERANDC